MPITNPLLAPNQQRTIDPYSENRYSSVINRYTRIISGGNDVILHADRSFKVTNIGNDNIKVTAGMAIKDDALIHMTEDYTMDFNDTSLYIDEVGTMIRSDWYMIVLQYMYARSLPAPKAYYRIIRDFSVYDNYRSNYIYLASVFIKQKFDQSGYEIDPNIAISYTHPNDVSVKRSLPSGNLLVVDGGLIGGAEIILGDH